MGIIDSKRYTLICPHCGLEESGKILDHGSQWGGSSWQTEANFVNFKTQWSGGGREEPQLESALCQQCGREAEKSFRYAG